MLGEQRRGFSLKLKIFFVYVVSLNLMLVAFQSLALTNNQKLKDDANTKSLHSELSEQCLNLGTKRTKILAKAMNGDASAQYCVGKTFLPVVGSSNDDPSRLCRSEVEAIKWFSKAAEQGVLDAIFGKASLLYSKEPEQAIGLFRNAAEAGHTLSMDYFGSALAVGVGVPKNEMQALMWLNIAASRKSNMQTAIATHRDYVEKRLSREEVAGAQKLSSSWKPKIKQGNITFQVQEVDCE
jgi:hypothetical protein